MKLLISSFLALGTTLFAADPIPNPLIDYPGFQRIVTESAATREAHRLTEAQFLQAMAEPGVILLDARSASMFELRHIRGAINLPFTDFTAGSLAKVIPSQASKILIYCNNNFLNSPRVFASKMATASLNLSTYTSLASYGYTNVFELGPLLKTDTTSIPFSGTETLPPAAK
ncbi:MAG: rhodanese-like domain-containing protein [Chthoniobacterales bacterium]